MNNRGVWLKDNQTIDKDGVISGGASSTLIASFWLRGIAASFVTWKELVELYLNAQDDFRRTNSEEGLKKFYNNSLGEPYYSKTMTEELNSDALRARSENLGEKVIPSDVRFLVAIADVQKNMFVCQVFGICPGSPFDIIVIDRFDIVKSTRIDEDGDTLWVKPGTYLDDWNCLRDNLIFKEYLLDDKSGRTMRPKLALCDSGGLEGVTTMAYNFYRQLRKEGLHHNFVLLRGIGSVRNWTLPRVKTSYPDAGNKSKLNAAMGDVPVLMMNPLLLKDDLSFRLECKIKGKGMFRYPKWLPDWWYDEMTSEHRTHKGWVAYDGRRNEAWDLAYYCIGACISEYIRIEMIDWQQPPLWAETWDKNTYITDSRSSTLRGKEESPYDFSNFGKLLAG
jgi:phage terminase large subunit GpA-like protein